MSEKIKFMSHIRYQKSNLSCQRYTRLARDMTYEKDYEVLKELLSAVSYEIYFPRFRIVVRKYEVKFKTTKHSTSVRNLWLGNAML